MINAKPTLKSTFKALLYLAPLLIITLVFTIWPLISSFLMSFYTKYNYFTNKVSALGGANFVYLWHDPDFHLAVRNTLIFVVIVVPVTVLLSLGIALLLNRINRLASFFRTIYFLPFVTSTVAIALVWNWIFHYNHGLLNQLLSCFGVHPIDWLNNPRYSLIALIIVCIWRELGFNIILFLAGLNNIDRRYYRAASVDGASSKQQLTNITWPLLTSTIVLVTVNAIITSFKVFDQVFALFHGTAGPANADLTMMYYLYQKFYVENQYTVAAASGIVLFGFIAIVTILACWYFRRHAKLLGGNQL
ncbi:N-Acetyl-D-glucosamine ABC transport system, permease protein 1 [Pediococcus damnosus]|uniref:N-Acetyl-D-glucosamine ABC transport system, permease protein 1 n=1 Tax=Pediococcus damnosus TaxID=51663 RepID=A0A0R2HC98_9LACO|nr:sugar ABC transporter permease [Pediococcus damnosus]AMV60399.1 N-Acetyl-D-glucosamine ABC transport system, permease protein 1 [Pediococcus damnosus]AMV63199.1 N-Acetyl-D-glucosamine ABC transport system, permease protein 1 [Pediococcus damnosus]AMV64649.1 N-Acetyl-D-glucosamine ABC transport system, permease protein 1 [Pediococcus damnosus]AMV66906.1 N-Acetyl-D-glucosamine ABC transport system, permease protein 1 [Pediococcus damnosus]AMV69490.1 N-Acetyl-D-glucosamine ABC transport system